MPEAGRLTLCLQMVLVAVALTLLGAGTLVAVAGLLFVYYLLFAAAIVASAAFAVSLVLVAVQMQVPVSGTTVVPAMLLASAVIAGISTVARLWLLAAPGVLRELRGEGAVLASLDIRPVGPEYPELAGTVTRVAQQFDLPAPEVRLVETGTPEAMAAGYRPSTSTLVLSTGLLDACSAAELEAVVAHELAHVRNRDAALMTALALPLSFARNAVVEGRSIDWEAVNERMSGTNDVEPYYLWKASFALCLLLYPVAVAGRVLAAVLSRARESVADRAAAHATGNPAALASALATLDARVATAPESDLRRGSVEAALSILPPREHERPGYFPWLRRWLLRNVYHTHPPTEERIDRLRRLER